MAAQTVFDQEGRQIAAASSLMQGMTLEIIHDPARQGDVDPLGAGGIRHLSRAEGRSPLLELLLQLKQHSLEE